MNPGENKLYALLLMLMLMLMVVVVVMVMVMVPVHARPGIPCAAIHGKARQN